MSVLEKYDKKKQTYPSEVYQSFIPEKGVWAGQSMFLEFPTTAKGDFHVLWTTKGHEVNGYPSAYKVYMESTDEYEAGIKIAGSYLNWQILARENTWFYREHLPIWRQHMAMRDASLAKKKIIENTKAGQTTAANSLKVWDKETKKVSRRNKTTESTSMPSSLVVDIEKFNKKIKNGK